MGQKKLNKGCSWQNQTKSSWAFGQNKKGAIAFPQVLRWLISDEQGDLEYVACTPLLPHLCLLLHGPQLGRLLALQGVDDGDLPGQGEARRQAGRHHWGQLWHWSWGEENYLSPVHCTGCQVEMARPCSRPQKNKIDVEISVGVVFIYIWHFVKWKLKHFHPDRTRPC